MISGLRHKGDLIYRIQASGCLGSSSYRWKTVYTTDLELKNNFGDYTIVEGENDLFLYNNKSGKTYKFVLQEIDKSEDPPKAGEIKKWPD